MSEPLDMPDSPGWWAYVGNDGTKYVRQLLVWELKGINLVKMQWEKWEKPNLAYVDGFKRNNPGKWYRLHMPWEEQQPAPERSVVYAVEHVVRYAEACAAKDKYVSDTLSRAIEAAHDWTRQRPEQQPAPYRDQAPRLVTQPAPSVPEEVRAAWEAIRETLNSATRDDYADALDVMDRWAYEQGGD